MKLVKLSSNSLFVKLNGMMRTNILVIIIKICWATDTSQANH